MQQIKAFIFMSGRLITLGLRSFFLLRLFCISINLRYHNVWNGSFHITQVTLQGKKREKKHYLPIKFFVIHSYFILMKNYTPMQCYKLKLQGNKIFTKTDKS